ncbi:hypothetical protein HC752_02695 [Vibrio sp. S9_S30]|uniref:hypothetical protein n=1 Tax=Vibrio sp. S9_S30 TaxID=2720226 RepID=UPI0016809AF3|nr:hypothetical protein [Vibrio sp. S9_S30]MBD1555846.1 hypothetical protein [Vibrio sp. S9_S30]
METTGFGMGSAAGMVAGAGVIKGASALGIALLATPVGWCFVIGSAITIGYLASKGGDKVGQGLAAQTYDFSKQIHW